MNSIHISPRVRVTTATTPAIDRTAEDFLSNDEPDDLTILIAHRLIPTRAQMLQARKKAIPK